MKPLIFVDIKYLEEGDTFHETGFGKCLNLRVIDKPIYNDTECVWTWKAFNIDTYEVVDYSITDEGSKYIHLYFSDETRDRIINERNKDVLTPDKDTIQIILNGYTKNMMQQSKYYYKTTGVGDMENVTTDVPLKGKTFDKAFIDENIPF